MMNKANIDLVNFIKSSFEEGLSAFEIEEKLRRAGWPEPDIVSAFGAVYAESPDLRRAPKQMGSVGVGGFGPDDSINEIKRILEDFDKRLLKLEGRPFGASLFKPEKVKEIKSMEAPSVVSAGVEKTKPIAEVKEMVETKVTGKLFAVIGIIAIVFGVGFFLKYAFENNLIGETGRVILGILGGLALLTLGDFLSRKETYRQYSFFLSGGGLALLYLSIYGAFNFYHLIAPTPAFIFMALISAGGTALALKQNSPEVAGLSLIGGFLTPFLVSTGADNQLALMSYILILDLGFLALSGFKKWYPIYYLDFFGTYAVFLAWYSRFYAPEKLGLTLIFLTLYGLIFLAASFLLSIRRRQNSNQTDLLATTLNAAIYFSVSYGILKPDYQDFLGFFFVLGALVYLLTAYLVSARNREDKYGVLALGGIGLVLLTIAVPIQLDKNWVTIAWAVEGLLLVWFGFLLKNENIRRFSLAVFVITVFRLFFFDSELPFPIKDFQLIFNQRFFTYLVGTASLFGAGLLYWFYKDNVLPEERLAPAALAVTANFLLVLIFSMEAISFFDQKIDFYERQLRTVREPFPLNQNLYGIDQRQQEKFAQAEFERQEKFRDETKPLRNAKNLSLSIIWALYASILMVAGIIGRFKSSRWLAIILFGIVIFKVFLYDITALSAIYRILSFIILGVILLVISFLFYRYKDKIKQFLT